MLKEEVKQLEHYEERVASPATWGRDGVPSLGVTEGHVRVCGYTVAGSVSLFVTHIITREPRDIPGWDSHQGPCGCPGEWSFPSLAVALWRSGPIMVALRRVGPASHLDSTEDLARVAIVWVS